MAASVSSFSNPHLLPKEVINQYEINVQLQFPIQKPESSRFSSLTPLCATLRGPKGFGPSPKKSKKKNKLKRVSADDEDEEEEDQELAREQGVIPEVVTNRMLGRMGFSVGIPLAIGLMFFPFFYYIKVGLKIDVPNWVPFFVSFLFFGSALLGVRYGIVSSSWDPLREGSLLGWNEAQKNWPVFWQSIWGGGSNSKRELPCSYLSFMCLVSSAFRGIHF